MPTGLLDRLPIPTIVTRLEKLEDPVERENRLEDVESSVWGLKDRADRLAEKMAEWERDAKRR